MKHVTNTGQIVREAAPQPQQAAPVAVPADLCERICAAIKAADDKSMDEAGYMLDCHDCIRIIREHFAASPQAAPAPPQQAPAPQPVALTDEQRIDWLCEEAEFTCGQWQVVIDSDKESFLDAVDEMARTAHGITQPSQQERT